MIHDISPASLFFVTLGVRKNRSKSRNEYTIIAGRILAIDYIMPTKGMMQGNY
jgi:hypothetical protein